MSHTPINHSYPSIINLAVYCSLDRSTVSKKVVNIPSPDQFGDMYTILFPSEGFKMAQREIFEMDPATYIFTIGRNPPDSSSIEASTGTNKVFVTTHEYHPRPPCTGQWYFKYSHNINLGSFLNSFIYIALLLDQVVSLCNLHNVLSISFSASINTNI